VPTYQCECGMGCLSGRTEYPMQAVYNPHFFECTIDTPELANYQLRIQEAEHERVIYDPYAFRSPRLTNLTCIYLGRKSSPDL